MLLEKDQSCLILVDVQEKLVFDVIEAEAMIDKCEWIMSLANDLQVPTIISEQYPKGLGRTIEPLLSIQPDCQVIDKVSFSCWQEPAFKNQLQLLNKKHIILIGIETHVCVLQTALDLVAADYNVYAAVDAVSCRHDIDHRYGLKRMKQAGVELVTTEMVFFEWIQQAGTPEFKQLSKTYLQNWKKNEYR